MRANCAKLARRTLGPSPDGIEVALDFVEQQVVAAAQSHLEVAPALALGSQPRTGPVRAAEIQHGAIDDHGLEMNARTQAHLEGIFPHTAQAWTPTHFLAEGSRWFGRVQDTDLYPARNLILEHLQHRTIRALTPDGSPSAWPRTFVLDHQFFQVGGGDPQAALRIHRCLHHGFVVSPSRDERERHRTVLANEIHGQAQPAPGTHDFPVSLSYHQGWKTDSPPRVELSAQLYSILTTSM